MRNKKIETKINLKAVDILCRIRDEKKCVFPRADVYAAIFELSKIHDSYYENIEKLDNLIGRNEFLESFQKSFDATMSNNTKNFQTVQKEKNELSSLLDKLVPDWEVKEYERKIEVDKKTREEAKMKKAMKNSAKK